MGLTEKEAAERLKAQGENTLGESRRTGPMRIFLGQFRDVMVMILLGATVISVLLGEISDAVSIILIVLLNAILGFVQEYRTENTLEALRSMTSPTAKCWRDGKLKEIDNGTRKTKLYSIKEILLLVKDCGGLDLSLDLDQTSPLN